MRLKCVALSAMVAIAWTSGPVAAQEPAWFPGTTVKVCQLTGDFDPCRRVPTASMTFSRFGIAGTDLGSSFEHRGKLWFLFGDTAGRPGERDVIGCTEARDPADVVLDFHRGGDGKFLPLTVRDIGQGAYEVPTCGISSKGRMVVLFTTDHTRKKTMGRSVLAVSDDSALTFEPLGELSRRYFINAAMAFSGATEAPEIPLQSVLVFGTGEYRKSSPRLLYLDEDRLGDARARRYLAGVEGGRPRWSAEETDAAPLFEHPVIGEISVAWIATLQRWVMLYNSSEPRGIVMRTAPAAWGPWSEASVILDPWRDGAYPQFQHVSWKHDRIDAFHDPRRENEWGGEYGPFLVPRFAKGDAQRTTLLFTLSTWNPYQVILARADVGRPAAAASRATVTVRSLPGETGWTATPGLFKRFEKDGRRFVTTHAGDADGTTGFARRDFTASRGGSVAFSLHGGHAEVVLTRAGSKVPAPGSDVGLVYRDLKAGVFGDFVDAMAGADSNAANAAVRWSVDRFAGERLRIWVIDHLTEPWGFVSVSEVEIVQ